VNLTIIGQDSGIGRQLHDRTDHPSAQYSKNNPIPNLRASKENNPPFSTLQLSESKAKLVCSAEHE